MDSIDFKLLVALYEDTRQSYQSLGRRVRLSAPAVRERVQRLRNRGILQGYMLSVDPSLLGRVDQLVFYHKHEWKREDALKALTVPDVAWVAWKMDGGLTVQLWPFDPSEAMRNLTAVLGSHPSGQAISERTSHQPLSLVDWEIIEALIDDPRGPLKTLMQTTGLSPKTLRRHLKLLILEQKLFISPRLGPLTDPGELVYTVAVFGNVSTVELRRLLGDAFLVNETHKPPVKYLLCRSDNLGGFTTRTQNVSKLQRVESVTVTLNREMFVSTEHMHTLVREKIRKLKKARQG